jgi:2,4-dichlorophenol 6-monooxygenase
MAVATSSLNAAIRVSAFSVPGSRLPHAWVGDNKRRLAMMDLAPYDRFTVITGIAGEQWGVAAEKVAHDLGVPLETVVIGPGREVTDLYYDWAKLRDIDESGALLVRPDKHIAWRSRSLPADPESALRTALGQVLGKGVSA